MNADIPEVAATDDVDRRIADPGVENRDKHPIGTTTGTGAGAATGAVVGTALGGPVGTVAGGVVGGVIGGAVGHGAAAVVHPEGDQVDGDVIPDPGTTPAARDRVVPPESRA